MLKQASVADLRSGALTRRDGHVVIVMRFHPRGVARELRDEYLRSLAPDEVLFREFKARQRELGDHDRAFAEVAYERRFGLDEGGLRELARLCEQSRDRDVYLVCQCRVGESCHRELLLLLAHEGFAAATDRVHRRYPAFEERIRDVLKG